MVGVSFGHSLGLAILSPLVGKSYDLMGFPATYLTLAGLGLGFLAASAWALQATPAETGRGACKQAGPAPARDTAPAQTTQPASSAN
jgi:OHS family lactose permease-like MFS transporter